MNDAVTTTTKDTQTTTEPGQEAPETEQGTLDTEAQDDQAIADMWGAVDADLDGEDAPTQEEEPEPEPEPEQESEAEPVQEPEQPAPAEQQATEPETEQPAPTQEQPPVQEQETRTEPEPEPVDVEALWSQREQALVDEHRIDDDLADAIITDPKEHLPKLLAKAQARAERMIWDNVNQVMPEAVQRVLDQQHTETQQKDKFYEAWPQLKEHVKQNPEAEQTITRMRDMFLQQPDAKTMTEDQIIRHVGAAAAVALGVPLQQTQSQSGNGQQQPSKQRETPRSAGGARNASAGQGKKLGAFEALDLELEPGDSESGDGKGATLF